MGHSIEIAKRYFELGLSLFEQEDFLNAKEKFIEALLLAPNRPSILINLSATLIQLNEWAECEKVCRKILTLEPENYDALLNLSNALSHIDRLPEALRSLDKAISVSPNRDQAWTNKGNIFEEKGDLPQAELCFNKAISINPFSQEAFIGRGNLRNQKKDYQLALSDFDIALKLNPYNPQAKWNKALSLLRLGNFTEGWKLFEARWEVQGMREHQQHNELQLWLGQESLKNKVILIYAEQGYGDTIQFCRYLPLLEKMGARVIFEVEKTLVDLMKSLSPTIQVFEKGLLNFDQLLKINYRCPIMSLALAFDTQLQTIPLKLPYLFTDKNGQAFWKSRLKEISQNNDFLGVPFRIGVAWFGSGHYAGKTNNRRDIKLQNIIQCLSPFASKQVEIHSLQLNPSTDDLINLAAAKIHSHHSIINNFTDTANLIYELDLIISVDTAVAHLAGALGKETWLLIPNPSDFMVLIDRLTHPWYEKTLLFHQETPKNWEAPLNKISNELKKLLQQRLSGEI